MFPYAHPAYETETSFIRILKGKEKEEGGCLGEGAGQTPPASPGQPVGGAGSYGSREQPAHTYSAPVHQSQ